MGKEPGRVERSERTPNASEEDLQRLESEIERSRRRLDAYVHELDRRRHHWLSRRPLAAVVAGAALAGIIGAAASILVRRGRRRRTSRTQRRAEGLRDAIIRVAQHPERVASDGKSAWSRVLVAAAPIVVRTLATAAWTRTGNGRDRRPH